ncbi:MAG: peptide-methionine (S)-S-oxide reductase MsrA [Thiotrichaceae bacterium]|nr:peptide-methionine (S)-S-oxide reductase MsrA [Thiotrichaceae bacterium]
MADSNGPEIEKATFAGGCFWCMEPPFDQLKGVISTTSGYAGGDEVSPTYKEVAGGRTGHTEVIQIEYDPAKIDYQKLLDVFWRNIDPTAVDRQFVDVGKQYRSEIFYHNDIQRALALASRDALAESGVFDKPIVTEVTALKDFYKAEEYHQDFYQKNPVRYKFYRYNSGRDAYLKKKWGSR